MGRADPQPNSFIIGSPMTGSSGVVPEEVAEIVSGILSGRTCSRCGVAPPRQRWVLSLRSGGTTWDRTEERVVKRAPNKGTRRSESNSRSSSAKSTSKATRPSRPTPRRMAKWCLTENAQAEIARLKEALHHKEDKRE